MDSSRLQTGPTVLLSDTPAVDTVAMGYPEYARTLAAMLAGKDNTAPIALGIHGPWGSGKTTLMKAIRARLDNAGPGLTPGARCCKTIWLQAPKYDAKGLFLAGLIETVVKAMAADGFFGLAKPKIADIMRRIDKSKLFDPLSRLIAGMDVSEFFSDFEAKHHLEHLDTFQKFFDDLIWAFLSWRYKLSGEEKPDSRQAALVVFVDDLDRCRQGHILPMLDTIHGFMERWGGHFVIGADHRVLTMALAQSLGHRNAGHYLEKIVHMAFFIPVIDAEAFEACIDLKKNGMGTLKTYLWLLMPVLHHSPRRLKRFVNHLMLLQQLLHDSNISIDTDTVVIWCVIGQVFEEFVADLKKNPLHLEGLQQQIRRLSTKMPQTPLWKVSSDRLEKENVPADLWAYIQRPHLAEMVDRLQLNADALKVIQSLSAATAFVSLDRGPSIDEGC